MILQFQSPSPAPTVAPRRQNRAKFIRALSAFVILLFLSSPSPARCAAQPGDWSRVPAILARIVPPVFPARDFTITDYGADGDGATDCTAAFQNAIAACNGAGGGRVVVPPGIFLTGAIHLLSNVNLYVAANAVIRFSTDTNAYLPVVFSRYQGIELMNFSPFIYAFEQQNIAVTGAGIIDGQAQNSVWYQWKTTGANAADESLLADMGATNLPVTQRIFGAGHLLRPAFLQPCRCQNVLIQGVTLTNSPMWVVTPLYCTNVTVLGVTVNNSGPNTDGCDPDSSTDVLIQNCSFNEGDDCLTVKSGTDQDGLRVGIPSQNVVIQNCKFRAGHGGLAIGSDTSGGITNVFMENCSLNSSALQMALRFKTCPGRGGYIQNIYVRNCVVHAAQNAIYMTMQYCNDGTNMPVVGSIDIRDCTFANIASQNLFLQGYDTNNLITDVTIANCRFGTSSLTPSVSNTARITRANNKGGGI